MPDTLVLHIGVDSCSLKCIHRDQTASLFCAFFVLYDLWLLKYHLFWGGIVRTNDRALTRTKTSTIDDHQAKQCKRGIRDVSPQITRRTRDGWDWVIINSLRDHWWQCSPSCAGAQGSRDRADRRGSISHRESVARSRRAINAHSRRSSAGRSRPGHSHAVVAPH